VGRLETLASAQVPEALAYLAQRPFDNVYVSWLIATRQAGRGDVALWRDDAGAIGGLCYFGLQIVPCSGEPAALEAFGLRARRATATRMIVGPRPAVEAVWERARPALRVPSGIRRSQPVYRLERADLAFTRAGAGVGRATLDELDEIALNSARMIAGELGGDPRRTSADFRGRTARIIAAGWWWRYRIERRLAFMCNVGSATAQTAQVQGVWTPPDMRGAGHATRALGAICDHLLDEYPTLCLYVNDFNTPAIALYERIGFRRIGEFATILFG
jgi:RimJ/RimL family protein N-acetyltransferase